MYSTVCLPVCKSLFAGISVPVSVCVSLRICV